MTWFAESSTVSSMAKQVIDTGEHITDHEFTPRDSAQPWGLCICGLSQATHKDAGQPYEPDALYRCPDCVQKGISPCTHDVGGPR